MAYWSPMPGQQPGSGSGLHFLNFPFGDTTFTKVFVGGLAWETTSETLRRHFEQHGYILEAVVISDKSTGRSKGYGFVTFRDAESARRACVDPSPIIDGRRVNCNLASLGRPRVDFPYALARQAGPYFGGLPAPRGTYVGSSGYQQAVPYSYQQAYAYPPYGYTSYGPEYVYLQNVFSSYAGQQHARAYGVPGTANATVYPFGQLGQPGPVGRGYTTVQGYTIPEHHIVQFSRPNPNGVMSASFPANQAPSPAGVAAPVPARAQFIVPAHSPQITQGSGSYQTAS